MIDAAQPGAGPQGAAPWAALSISQFTRHVAALLAADEILCDVWVRGEVSNLSRPGSGHLYFALKDDRSCLNCVMWRSSAQRLCFQLETGAQVTAHGQVGVYEARGQYQLVVDELQPDGIGALYLALEQLKRQLEAEGLFRAERKRPLPLFPERVAVVTSLSGAAVQDICSVLRRGPLPPSITLVPAIVQGQEAAASVAAAIALANQCSRAEVLIVARGGGSAEDLWPFNSEAIARAIAGSRIPVISAVGHETDTTLADFVADRRCLTPTAAAEQIAQARESILAVLLDAPRALGQALGRALDRQRHPLALLAARRCLSAPLEIVDQRRQRLDDLHAHLRRGMEDVLNGSLQNIALLAGRLESLSPLAVLGRGYATVSRAEDDSPVRSIAEVAVNAAVRVTLRDGAFGARVTEVGTDGWEKDTAASTETPARPQLRPPSPDT